LESGKAIFCNNCQSSDPIVMVTETLRAKKDGGALQHRRFFFGTRIVPSRIRPFGLVTEDE
jgi:hypothetical protein